MLATGIAVSPSAQAAPGDDRYDAAYWRSRQDDYLAFATAGGVSPGSSLSVLANATRAERQPGFVWDSNAPDPSDYADQFQKLAQFQDTGDFNINDFLFLLNNQGAAIRPDLRTALEDRVKAFKYWWTEPTPPGIVDSQYYWTENHLIIFLANEYVAGRMFPDAVFANSGMTGQQHMDHARPLILKWLQLRARFGFSEWLSNVYYMEDMKGLLLLAEWSQDPQLERWSSAMLDVLFVELASHTHDGAFGSTHGRSYQKDKLSALTEDTFTSAKLLFDDTSYPYQGVDNAVLLATAKRYRPPEVARRIVADPQVGVVRQHQSLPLDPTAPVTPDPVPPYGLAYDDPMVWWGMGGQFPWQIVPLSVNMIQTYDLWETTNFQQAADLRPIVESSTIPQLQDLARLLGAMVNAGLLSEVDTYTWRSPEVMLSTAQDWRPGQRSEQAHVWQATLDPRAQVFTNHPRDPVPLIASYDGDGGYWTGEATLPRAAQHENVNISIYAPQYAGNNPPPLNSFNYLDETHAYFPVERFDQVVEQNGWVIGRKGDGYVALWSWRPTTWRTYDAATEFTFGLTQRFDLQALGGADNVWISEVGRAADWSGAPDPFAAFVSAITSAPVTVTPLGAPHVAGSGFDVAYTSPTQGAMTYGWTTPLVVDGGSVALHGYPRWSSPWTEVAWDTYVYAVSAGGASLSLDFTPLITGVEPPESTTTTSSIATSATTATTANPSSSTVATTTSAPGSGAAGAAARPAAVTPRFTG